LCTADLFGELMKSIGERFALLRVYPEVVHAFDVAGTNRGQIGIDLRGSSFTRSASGESEAKNRSRECKEFFHDAPPVEVRSLRNSGCAGAKGAMSENL
jgi:hypothetical protein